MIQGLLVLYKSGQSRELKGFLSALFSYRENFVTLKRESAFFIEK